MAQNGREAPVQGLSMPGVGEDHTESERRRVTVAEAAEALGISAEAVRMRIRRGTLAYERHEGTVYVLLDTDQTRHVDDVSADRTELLIAEMQDRIRSLEEANRENRRIIAALTQRIPELEAPREPRQSPERASEEQERAEPRSSTGGPQEATERPFTEEDPQPRSWWRRMFGG